MCSFPTEEELCVSFAFTRICGGYCGTTCKLRVYIWGLRFEWFLSPEGDGNQINFHYAEPNNMTIKDLKARIKWHMYWFTLITNRRTLNCSFFLFDLFDSVQFRTELNHFMKMVNAKPEINLIFSLWHAKKHISSLRIKWKLLK